MNQEKSKSLFNFQKMSNITVNAKSQQNSLDMTIVYNQEQCWPERDLFFIYLTQKHPDHPIIQLQILPQYLNRTILQIQIIKTRQIYQSKLYSFDSEYNLIFANDLYVPSFFQSETDQIFCKCLLQNHVINDIFFKLQIERQSESERCMRSFNQLNFFKTGFISGKFLRPKKIKFFQQNFHISSYALKQLYGNLLLNSSRHVYELKLNFLILQEKNIQDPFFNFVFKQIKNNGDSYNFQSQFKKLHLTTQEYFEPTSSQSWYNFLCLGFEDNILKEIIQFSALNRSIKIVIRQLTQKQKIVIERYYGYFKSKLQKILKNIELLKILSVRQLERPLIQGIFHQKKWSQIKNQYQKIQFDWKFSSNIIIGKKCQTKRVKNENIDRKDKVSKLNQQQGQVMFQQQNQAKKTLLKKIMTKKGRKKKIEKEKQLKKIKQFEDKIIQMQDSQQERQNLKKFIKIEHRRSRKWNEDQQFLLFLIDKTGLQQVKNVEKVLNKKMEIIQKYFQEYIQEIRIKYSNKFQNYKNYPQSIRSIKNWQLKKLIQLAIKSQERYERGKGRNQQLLKKVQKNKYQSVLNDSSTTIGNSNSYQKDKKKWFTQQQEVLMYLLQKTYGLQGLLAQKLLKARESQILQYFDSKNIKQRGCQLQAYYQEYPELLQFENNMHIRVLMNKVICNKESQNVQ